MPDQQVLRLDIPVDDVFAVQVPQSTRQRVDVLCGAAFTEAALFHQLLVQLALGRVLQNQVHALLIPEVAEQS